MNSPQIALRGIERVFHLGDSDVHALRNLNLDIGAGEYVAVMGPSGSGKSTLLNLLGLLDRPNTGQYLLEGRDVTTLSPDEQAQVRSQRVAIARATIMQPAMILADEPTGNLDRSTGEEVVRLLEGLNAQGVTLIVVTHDGALGARARRQLRMEDGAIKVDTARDASASAESVNGSAGALATAGPALDGSATAAPAA